jgi:hypothetical protein
MTAMLLLVLPLIVLWVFQRSERATREWVGAGLDLDLMLHDTFASDALAYTRFGTFLQQLRQRFAGPVVVDMLCLLRVELELSIQAKACSSHVMLVSRCRFIRMRAVRLKKSGTCVHRSAGPDCSLSRRCTSHRTATTGIAISSPVSTRIGFFGSSKRCGPHVCPGAAIDPNVELHDRLHGERAQRDLARVADDSDSGCA